MNISIWKMVLLLTPCAMLQPLGMDIFVSGLPQMKHDLGISDAQIQYVLTSFMVATGFCQMIIGLCADKYGRRVVMMLALLTYAFSSLLCALSNDIAFLTVSRFIQGTTAAACLVIAFTVTRDVFNPKEASKVFSYLGCTLGTTTMVAPLLGTWLMAQFGGWQATFYFLVAISLIILVISYICVPETRPRSSQPPSLSELMQHQKQVLYHKPFWVFTASGATAMTGLFLFFSIGSIVLIDVLKISPYGFSIIFAANAVMYFIANFISSGLSNKLSSMRICKLGNYVTCMGAMLMILSAAFLGMHVSLIIISNMVITLGGGLMIGPATSASLEPFKQSAGVASGIFGTLQYGGAALIGFMVTRTAIDNVYIIAVPMGLLAILNLYLLRSNLQQCSHEYEAQNEFS